MYRRVILNKKLLEKLLESKKLDRKTLVAYENWFSLDDFSDDVIVVRDIFTLQGELIQDFDKKNLTFATVFKFYDTKKVYDIDVRGCVKDENDITFILSVATALVLKLVQYITFEPRVLGVRFKVVNNFVEFTVFSASQEAGILFKKRVSLLNKKLEKFIIRFRNLKKKDVILLKLNDHTVLVSKKKMYIITTYDVREVEVLCVSNSEVVSVS